jgi:hypothetical protein
MAAVSAQPARGGVPRAPAVAVAVAVAVILLCGTVTAAAAGWTVGAAGGSNAHSRGGTLVPPTGLSTVCGTGPNKDKVTVSWAAAPQATSYSILQSSTSATTGYSTVATGVAATTWTSPSLANGSYWFEVVTVTGNWSSAGSTATAQRTITSSACS